MKKLIKKLSILVLALFRLIYLLPTMILALIFWPIAILLEVLGFNSSTIINWFLRQDKKIKNKIYDSIRKK